MRGVGFPVVAGRIFRLPGHFSHLPLGSSP
jgi:hypothetical protein